MNTTERSRAIGTEGLAESQAHVLWRLGVLDYYDITLQDFNVSQADASFRVRGTTYSSNAFTFSPTGAVVAPLVLVANLGCDAVRWPRHPQMQPFFSSL